MHICKTKLWTVLNNHALTFHIFYTSYFLTKYTGCTLTRKYILQKKPISFATDLPLSTVPAILHWCSDEVYVLIACSHWDLLPLQPHYHATKAIRWLGWSSFLLVLPFLCPQRPKLNSRHQRASAFKHPCRPPPTHTYAQTHWPSHIYHLKKKTTFPTYSTGCSRQ